MKNIYSEEGFRPIKAWTDVEDDALAQARNLARLPFVDRHGIALMPDCHLGKGTTVGTVIATDKAIIPAAVGVDIGCGMNAVRLSLKASDLPDSLLTVRRQIERDVPLGAGGSRKKPVALGKLSLALNEGRGYTRWFGRFAQSRKTDEISLLNKAESQLGTLGSGNHFIELCTDENQDVWVMLHSGSRGIGNMIGSYFIEKARRRMERLSIHLPDGDLAWLAEGEDDFDDYVEAVNWAQDYALENRRIMMETTIAALRRHIPIKFTLTREAINCHHNYVEKETHFGRNLWVTRKGAIRARVDDLGIIPGSMGQRSYIVRGKGELNPTAPAHTVRAVKCPEVRREVYLPWPTWFSRPKGSSVVRIKWCWTRYPHRIRTSMR